MSNPASKFELHRAQLEESLTAVADSMRNCAQIAEAFAKIVKDSAYSQEAAELLLGASDDHAKGKRKAALSPEDGDGPKKRKRNTKPKDPNAPKRPASSYILFQNEVRKELKEQHPDLSNSDLLGLISELWKKMPEDQKETYNNAMKTAKAQYSEEKKAYDNRTPEEIDAANAATAEALKAKKANAKPRGPKPGGAGAAATPAAAIAVKARPPPAPEEVSHSSESSEEDDSEDEEPHHNHAPVARKPAPDTESSSEEEEEEEVEEPQPKRRRGVSVQPKEKEKKEKEQKSKSKKGSKV